MISLQAGQNTGLSADYLRFTVQSASGVSLGALVVDAGLRARDAQDYVGSAGATAPGVTVGQGSVELTLSRLRPGAEAVLLFVAAPNVLGALTANLAENGAPAAQFAITPSAGERALICFEVYRRNGSWKLRALGQGYAGGEAELLRAHGVSLPNTRAAGTGDANSDRSHQDWRQGTNATQAGAAFPTGTGAGNLNAGPGVPPTGPGASPLDGGASSINGGARTFPSGADSPGASGPSHPGPSAAHGASPSPGAPLEVAHGLQRMWMIFEDAARSAAALSSARDYAADRLDRELSEAVSNPATRNTPAAETARVNAQRRHDELVATATQDHRRDSDHLAREIAEADSALPAALATWLAPAWSSRDNGADGIRLGELYGTDRSELRIPYCVPVPLNRPLWVDTESSAAASRVVGSLVARLVAALPHRTTTVDVIDLTGGLRPLTSILGPLLAGRPVITDHMDISARLSELASAAELAEMAYNSGQFVPPREHRILVVADFPHGYQTTDIVRLGQLMVRGDLIGLSLVIIGSGTTDFGDGPLTALAQSCRHLPTMPGTPLFDPWTGNPWELDLDMLPMEPELASRYLRL
ncbi:TerD family protein [Nocardia camponoti]|uniref:Export associated protein n=1 Tax=Nocardia camponoti TaxID=1616106 RepID=A0A917QJQ7_9NOCA|nr:TerD family protein [Nocardia camponoti]GGK53728.1 export associated protein [Nocardia camponoti]